MHYEFITTIATILLVGATIAGFVLSAARAVTRSSRQQFALFDERFKKIDEQFEMIDKRFEKVDERFEKVDERFEKVDERFEKVDERFAKIDERFFEMQKEFTAVHAAIARLEGLIKGLLATPATPSVPQLDA